VRRLLAEVRRSGEAAPHELAFDLRTAARLLERALAADPRGSALLVGPGADWYQTPDGQRIDLRRRGVLRAVLDRLVDERLRTPGRAISVAALFEACWPGERALPDAAAARVYVVISSLRKLGLRHVIQRRAEGYLLDADAAVARKT